MIRVLIVDDMKIVRECMKMSIENNSDFEVVGCASDGIEAIEMFRKCKPDVVLMDIFMPALDGIEATIKIKNENKNVKILVLSSVGDEGNVIRAIKNGADGYVLKDIGVEELILAIQCINKGLSFVHKNVYNVSMLNNIDEPDKINIEKQQEIREIYNKLTEREKSVLEVLSEGMANEEIATSLNISEGRVRNVVSSLISKFMLNNRTQLAITAVKFYYR